MKFTIITPSFNQGAYIRECLESVLLQLNAETGNAEKLKKGTEQALSDFGISAFQPFTIQHLVMDGGSTDETVAILEEWERNAETLKYGNAEKLKSRTEPSIGGYTRPTEPDEGKERSESGLKYRNAESCGKGAEKQKNQWTAAGSPLSVFQGFDISEFVGRYEFQFISEPDHGQTDAINKGMRRATGDVLAYVCSDDFYEPGALAAVARIFATCPEVDVVYGDTYFLEGDSGWKRLKVAGPYSRSRLREHNFIGQPSVFWRRRVLEKRGELDAGLQYAMDLDWWLRLSDLNWHYVERPLASMRLHMQGKTAHAIHDMWVEAEQVLKKHGCPEEALNRARWLQGVGGRWYVTKRKLLEMIGSVWMRLNE